MTKLLRNVYSLIRQDKSHFFLIGLTFLFVLLRIPSLIEPHWYGDEGIYQIIAIALNKGSVLYRDIWDNKPPLLYVIYALVNGSLFGVKLFSMIAGVASIVVLFLLSRVLFQQRRSVYVSTGIFSILFALPLLEGNIANAENFMVFPILLGFLVIYTHKPWDSNKRCFGWAGFLFGVAFLIKVVAVFEVIAVMLFLWMVSLLEKKDLSILRNKAFRSNMLMFTGAFIFPICVSLVYFLMHGALGDYFRATFSKNVGYVGVQNYFLFPLGWLVIKCSIVLVLTGIIFKFREKLGKRGIAIALWYVFSGFSAFFSDRPYTHYILMLLPPFSLLCGLLFEKKVHRTFILGILIVTTILVYSNFRLYTRVMPYYQNYVGFMLQTRSEYEYQRFFDRLTPVDYALADFISATTKDNESIFVWSDSVQPYILSGKIPPGKYVPAYHIIFYADGIEETKKSLDNLKPRYMIKVKDDATFYKLNAGYSPRYVVEGVAIYERQF